MKEVVLKNNSQSTVEVPLYEKVPVVVAQTIKRHKLEPGEELRLGVDVPTDRIRHYAQLGSIDIDLESRETTEIPESETVTGVRGSGGKGAVAVKYADRTYITVKFNEATIKSVKNPNGDQAYWMGIAVAAPEGAATLERAFGASQNELNDFKEPVQASGFDKKVVEGKDGWYYYTDAGAAKPNQWFRARWRAADGTIIEEIDYYLDFSKLTLEKA